MEERRDQDEMLETLVREQMLLTRFALQGVAPKDREVPLDRSAVILLSRLRAQGPMTVAELADAFDMDVSTIHRQTTAAMKSDLLERITDPDGGVARKLRPTDEGLRRLDAELEARKDGFGRILADWSQGEIADFVRHLRRYNQAVEARRGKSWPRDETACP
jgi:DNA-binding MarR family transcriptional regulator